MEAWAWGVRGVEALPAPPTPPHPTPPPPPHSPAVHTQVADIEAAEKNKMREKVEKILANNINCFINRQLIYNFPEELFADAGVMAIGGPSAGASVGGWGLPTPHLPRSSPRPLFSPPCVCITCPCIPCFACPACVTLSARTPCTRLSPFIFPLSPPLPSPQNAEHADFDGIENLALVLGGEISSTFETGDAKLGSCKLIEEIMIGEDRLIHFSGEVLEAGRGPPEGRRCWRAKLGSCRLIE